MTVINPGDIISFSAPKIINANEAVLRPDFSNDHYKDGAKKRIGSFDINYNCADAAKKLVRGNLYKEVMGTIPRFTGSCSCTNGQVYEVGAESESCSTNSCNGGKISSCAETSLEKKMNMAVYCDVDNNNWSDLTVGLNFANDQEYLLSYRKICSDSTIPGWDPSTFFLVIIAAVTVYIATLLPPLKDENNNAVTEELKWYHAILFVLCGSAVLI
jgi:hypothetical protein